MRELIKDTTERNLGKTQQTCRVCGSSGMFDTYLAREMMQDTREEFRYFECENCQCLQIESVPDNLGKYYGENYYSFAVPENDNMEFEKPVTNHAKILDVGCGSGAWLVQMAQAGFGNLWGCDPFLEKPRHYGERVYIKNCAIHDLTEDGTFDWIRMGDSYEHVTDPLEVMQSAYRLLKPQGTLTLHIPTYPNMAFELFGPHWYQLDAPRHIFLHSIKSIQYLADQTGFHLHEFKHDSNEAQVLRSYFYQYGVPFHEIDWECIHSVFSEAHVLKIRASALQANENHYGDHAVVTLIKP